METLEDDDTHRLKYVHRLVPGTTTIQHYGLKLAKICFVPKDLIRDAEELIEQLPSQQPVKT